MGILKKKINEKSEQNGIIESTENLEGIIRTCED
jgi:hypothetical protein